MKRADKGTSIGASDGPEGANSEMILGLMFSQR